MIQMIHLMSYLVYNSMNDWATQNWYQGDLPYPFIPTCNDIYVDDNI